ncbi:MAG: 3-phosphoshikimate 1-carboxyvinyltransferase [Armatimonadota bacterium]|nr:3-phosphoshikimate 1-carboxyvinyltransferase [Armatimonadota bacterium]MDR7451049.1 3-phosphoshikimate 1-carboxyvinyltransferase [Armatimonadota bacterium]MDR7465930.1 3-phosphoshikimate 1-carboxyvinyltransferase [Armatimonadota bacterium]MDR7493995.1 3-phosphoshikimate 1-carboxyvinyltransferase [Armatimonadota bacterium]MDR7498445.1 3-phosphoshikimate 1-carboxyvinyltransferase [Armatimonadota bacterium]
MDVVVAPAARLAGTVRVPGDKSISHRAAILGALASGTTTIRNFLRAEDCLRTLECLRELGVTIEEDGAHLVVHGAAGRLREPDRALDAGNSGTTMRLLAGVAAAQPIAVVLDGDASLRRRPMDRIAEPLRKMGAYVGLRDGRYPPLRITGARLRGITYELPVPSAQVKSAVLLAGLLAESETVVVEPVPTRDHTERMLARFGVPIRRDGRRIVLPPGLPVGCEVTVPGDISSAAFFLAAAARAGSKVTVEDVGVNPTRTGVLEILEQMGAAVEQTSPRDVGGEPTAAVTVRGGRLRGVTIRGPIIPRVIDELPVLCVVAAAAEGKTVIRDAAELRAKESDRIAVIAAGLRALGVAVKERPDGIEIRGGGLRGGVVDAAGDHRLAMAFVVAGLFADAPVTVRGAEAVAVSFPGFFDTLDQLGGKTAALGAAEDG